MAVPTPAEDKTATTFDDKTAKELEAALGFSPIEGTTMLDCHQCYELLHHCYYVSNRT